MSLSPNYNKIISGAIQQLDADMYNELVKTGSMPHSMLGEAARKSVETMTFSVAKMDNGFLIVFGGIGAEKRFVAKTGNEILEIVAGQLTATRLAEDSLGSNRTGDCENKEVQDFLVGHGVPLSRADD